MLTGIVELAEEVFAFACTHRRTSRNGRRIRTHPQSALFNRHRSLQAARGEEDGAPVTGAIVVPDQAEKISLWARLMKFVKDNFLTFPLLA